MEETKPPTDRVMTSVPVPVPPHETQTLTSSTSSITTLDPDIVHTHILTRLDVATLTAASSVSSELRHLCTDENLWRNICTATWPSVRDPIASHVISTFPGGHRSFFSDAFPSLHHDNHSHRAYPPPTELISAVDIYCQGKPLCSRVKRTQTQNIGFLSNHFLVDFVELNVLVPIPVKYKWWMEYLQENLSLSWIVIDPTQKRAANLSSCKPVSMQRELADLEVVYAVVMAGEHQVLTEMVQCLVKVTCRWDNGLHVRKVMMEMQDMDGWPVMGREAAMILQSAIENGERKKVDELRAKERFHNYSCKTKERRGIVREKASSPHRTYKKRRFVPNKKFGKAVKVNN